MAGQRHVSAQRLIPLLLDSLLTNSSNLIGLIAIG